MEALRAETGLTDSGLYKKLQAARRKRHGLVTVVQAAALVAGEHGIKIERYFQPSFLSELARFAQPDSGHMLSPPKYARVKAPRGEVNIKLPSALSESYPFIDAATAAGARRMAGTYPLFFLFENSVRALVLSRMVEIAGEGWWQEEGRVPAEVKRLVKSRQQDEDRKRWLDKRGAHEIFYTDMDDLRRIILGPKNWDLGFKPLFPDQPWVEAMFQEMEALRNVVAHNNPLSADNAERLESNFKHWKRQLRGGMAASGPAPH